MKKLALRSCNQSGFTLLESLIALLIFAIIILGSGLALSKMLNQQREMHVNFILINTMQTKLQNALNNTSATDICSSIDLNSIIVSQTTYYIGCSTEQIDINSTLIRWPVLAMSKTQSVVQSCAEGTDHTDCYVVGR
jgi:prepilin-type N-terminal cleavage/methylation domain-containing protein